MKLTESKLRSIIREKVSQILESRGNFIEAENGYMEVSHAFDSRSLEITVSASGKEEQKIVLTPKSARDLVNSIRGRL